MGKLAFNLCDSWLQLLDLRGDRWAFATPATYTNPYTWRPNSPAINNRGQRRRVRADSSLPRGWHSFPDEWWEDSKWLQPWQYAPIKPLARMVKELLIEMLQEGWQWGDYESWAWSSLAFSLLSHLGQATQVFTFSFFIYEMINWRTLKNLFSSNDLWFLQVRSFNKHWLSTVLGSAGTKSFKIRSPASRGSQSRENLSVLESGMTEVVFVQCALCLYGHWRLHLPWCKIEEEGKYPRKVFILGQPGICNMATIQKSLFPPSNSKALTTCLDAEGAYYLIRPHL